MKWIKKINEFFQHTMSSNNNVEEYSPSSIDICNIPMNQSSFSFEDNRIEDDSLLQLQEDETEKDTGFHQDEELEEVVSQEEQPSLLDNYEYMNLAQQCCDMLGELDRMCNQVQDDHLKKFILQQKNRIREALLLSGASLINEDTEFNILRHKTTSGGLMKNGAIINEIIEPGVEIEGRIMVKALIL